MLIKSIGQISLPGGRDENQDAIQAEVLPNGWALCIVCDGMGGLDNGRLASAMAVNQISAYCQAHYPHQSAKQLAQHAIDAAYQAIVAQSEYDETRMGTTVALLLLTPEAAVVAHLGDSRIYQARKGKIVFRTRDDSEAFEMVANGELTEEQARTHPSSNKLTNGLIPGRYQPGQAMELSYLKNDLFFLCTDGVWNLRPEPELIAMAASEKDAGRMVPWLLNELDRSAHLQGGGHDNLSAIALRTQQRSLATASVPPKREYLRWLAILAGGVAVSLAALWYWQVKQKNTGQPITESPSQREKALEDSLRRAEEYGRLLEDSLRALQQQETAPPESQPKKEQKRTKGEIEKKSPEPLTPPLPQDSSRQKEPEKSTGQLPEEERQ